MELTTNELVRTTLESCLDSQEVIGLHTTPEELDRLSVGFLIALHEDCCLFQTFDEVGDRDSVLLCTYDRLLRISLGGPYLQAFASRIKVDSCLPSPNLTPSNLQEALAWSLAEGRIISVFEEAGGVSSGSVVSYDDEALRLSVYSAAAEYSGDEILFLGSIVSIAMDGRRERFIEELLRAEESD